MPSIAAELAERERVAKLEEDVKRLRELICDANFYLHRSGLARSISPVLLDRMLAEDPDPPKHATKAGGSARDVTLRRFKLVRAKDVSGTSGTGVVAEGVEYSNGRVSISWISQLECCGNYANVKTLLGVHGHEGATEIEWIDP